MALARPASTFVVCSARSCDCLVVSKAQFFKGSAEIFVNFCEALLVVTPEFGQPGRLSDDGLGR